MSATSAENAQGFVEARCDHALVPHWHQDWIDEHAGKLAQQTFLATVDCEGATPPSIDQHIWEAAAIVVIHDVHFALALIEDADTIRNAALFGAEQFLRRFFQLVFTSRIGGRA